MNVQWYFTHHSRLMLLPLLLLLLSLILLGLQYSRTGDIMLKDVTLQGGTSITVYTEEYGADLEGRLSAALGQQATVRELSEFGTGRMAGYLIETSSTDEALLKKELESLLGIGLTKDNSSSEFTGSSLGQSFYRDMLKALLLAFTFMALVVFISFRSLVPSLAIVFIAFSDIMITLAITNLFGIRISTAGIAALLLLIGYSVDTDVLLTTRLLKRKEGTPSQRLLGAIKTGLTMTATTLTAVLIGYFISSSLVLQQMFLIIALGLFVDVLTTYFLNGPLLIMYMKRKGDWHA